jgi:periplasmic divalent cation tolerance protein
MTDKRVVLTTASSQDEARRIANTLVERRLAACVNIVSKIDSIYRWKDKIEESQEFLLLIKTNQKEVADLRDAIKELHSYELPECIALPVDDGSEDYLKWIDDSVGSDERRRPQAAKVVSVKSQPKPGPDRRSGPRPVQSPQKSGPGRR